MEGLKWGAIGYEQRMGVCYVQNIQRWETEKYVSGQQVNSLG